MLRLRVRPLVFALPLAITLGAGQTTYLLQTLAGSDDVGDGGPATSALIAHVEGVAADSLGNLYLADTDGHRVRKVTPAGVISTVAGTGHAGFGGDGGPASAAQLNTPYGVAADRAGNIYIADLGNGRVRRVARDGTITTIAGGGTTPPIQADGHMGTDIALKSPRNVAVDASGNLYLSDFSDHRVYQLTPAGVILQFAGNGSKGVSGDNGPALFAQLNSPAGLAIDTAGALYIADSSNGRVRKVWRGLISTAGDTGKPGGGSAIPLGIPTGVAVDTDGSLIIADPGNGQVLRVTPLMQVATVQQTARDVAVDAAGTVFTCSAGYVYRRLRTGALSIAAGSGAYAYSGDGGPASKARLNQPSAIARDSAGTLYIADTANHRVRRITADGVVVTIAGTGTAGAAGDGGPAINAQLNAPLGVAVDRSGAIYIADTGNHRVRRINIAGIITTLAGTGEHGFSGDNGPALGARLDTPSGAALDGDGNLYIADTGNHVIRRVTASGVITTVAGNSSRGFAGDGGLPLAASFDSPRAVAVDGNGGLFVADTGNHRVRRVSLASALGTGIINTYPASDAAVWRQPRGLAVNAAGDLFLTDAADQRVFLIEASGRISTIAGDGYQGFTGETALALKGRLDTPTGIAADGDGNLYITDTGNQRVRKLARNIELVTPPPIDAAATILNAASLAQGSVSPGEIVSLFGAGMSADGVATQVLFNGHQAALLFVSSSQINLQVPYSMGTVETAEVQVVVNSVTKLRLSVGVVDACPALFTVSNGTGQVAALNEDGTYNSPDNPAARGSIVTMFATGFGRITPELGDGQPAGYPSPAPVLPVALKIGDYAAELLFAQSAPGFAGLMQINARVPAGFAPPGTLALTLEVGTATSPAGVVISVK